MANINLNNRGHKFILNGAEYLVSATIGGNLIEKTITENGEYDASDDNIQGEQTFVNHTALSKNAWTSIDLPEEYLGYISSDEFRMRIETLTTPINTTFEFSEIAVYTPNMSYEDATLIDEREQLSETTKLYCAITSDKSKFYFYVQANTFIPYTFHQATVTVNKEVNGYSKVVVAVEGGGGNTPIVYHYSNDRKICVGENTIDGTCTWYFMGYYLAENDTAPPSELSAYLPSDDGVLQSENYVSNQDLTQNGWCGFYNRNLRLWTLDTSALQTGYLWGVVNTFEKIGTVHYPQHNGYFEPDN